MKKKQGETGLHPNECRCLVVMGLGGGGGGCWGVGAAGRGGRGGGDGWEVKGRTTKVTEEEESKREDGGKIRKI